MSEARDDLFAVAALLTELDRVLHPLERGERGDFRVDPPLPPSLPTPGAQKRGGEAGRAVKTPSLPSGPRSMGFTEPDDVTPPVIMRPARVEVPTVTDPIAPIRRRAPRPGGTSAHPQEPQPTLEPVARSQDGQQPPTLAPLVVPSVPALPLKAAESRPLRPRTEDREVPSQRGDRPEPESQKDPAVPLVVEAREEAPGPRRSRVPRPAVERSAHPTRISARVPESPTRRHRVARATTTQAPPQAPPVEQRETPARASPRTRRTPRVLARPPAPDTRKAPPFQEELGPRRHDRPGARTPRPSQLEERGESSLPPSRSTRHTAPGPVHIEVKTLLPPPGVQAPPPPEAPDEEPVWEEAPDYELETSARTFFMNGRRLTAKDAEALHQAEQRLRRRMTGRSLWRRRG